MEPVQWFSQWSLEFAGFSGDAVLSVRDLQELEARIRGERVRGGAERVPRSAAVPSDPVRRGDAAALGLRATVQVQTATNARQHRALETGRPPKDIRLSTGRPFRSALTFEIFAYL